MKRFYEELKRRRVFRVAVVYAIVGWLLVQVAAITFPALHVPGWGLTLVVLLVLIGFPVALVLAWAFEATPDGVRRASAVAADDSPERWRAGPAAGVAVGIAVAVVGLGFAVYRGPLSTGSDDSPLPSATASEEPVPAAIRSIAVLPFSNLSAEESNEYFSDGITEDVLTALAKIGDLHVISRTSSMAYKGTGKTLRQIGRELGVEAVLEGSVRRQGDRVRIVAQLIDARDDRQLWAETYDRELTDLFAIQSEIAEAIAAALHAELTDVERGRILAGGTANLDAYELYLRGREVARQPGNEPEDNETAIAHFQRALELDPDYALAHAGLAMTYVRRQEYRGVAWGDSAILSSARAITRDPRAAEGYVAMSMAQGWWGLRDAAMESLELALERNPNHAEAVSGMAHLLEDQGRHDQALEWALRVVALEPTYAPHYADVGWILADLGADAAAKRWFEKRIELTPEDAMAYVNFVDFHLGRGEVDRAAAYLEKVIALDSDHPVALYRRAHVAIERGDLANAADLMERWLERRSDEWEPPDHRGWIRMRLGRDGEARADLRASEEMARLWIGRGDQGAWPHMVLARVHVARGDTEAAIRSLERAVEQGARGLAEVRTGAVFEPLRDDPRLQALLDRVDRERERMRKAARADSVTPPGD